MDIRIGQGLLLKIPHFANGSPCTYPRTFLVIELDTESKTAKLLNISTTEGKEEKVLYNSNKNITNFNPPFDRPSFVKLDEIYKISYERNINILRNGQPLNGDEFIEILQCHEVYKNSHKVITSESVVERFTPYQLKSKIKKPTVN